MKETPNHKNFSDQNSQSDKEITDALDRIISRAKRENNALSKVLKKMDKQNAADN
jgi:hypothetical protein